MKKYLFLSLVVFALISGCKKDPFATDDSGTFTDTRDQREYQWVKIGTQIWMAENMAYLPYVNPSTVSSVTEARSYVFGYEGTDINAAMATTNWDTYGALYNFEAAKIACPTGWHLPTDEEWKTMEKFLGMPQDVADNTGIRVDGSVGLQLKSASAFGGSTQGNNSSGFNALPGGYCNSGISFDMLKTAGIFWTATAFDAENAYDRYLDKIMVGVDRGPYPKRDGYSVRCVRD